VSASVSGGRQAPPYFERHVFVCANERPEGHPRGCCKNKGAAELRDYMKARAKEAGLARVRVNMAGCLDRCEHGPSLVVYPEGVWYSPKTKADIDEIVETHLKAGGRVERLLMPAR
jgi:(2Fe-2S) ferredoxin